MWVVGDDNLLDSVATCKWHYHSRNLIFLTKYILLLGLDLKFLQIVYFLEISISAILYFSAEMDV